MPSPAASADDRPIAVVDGRPVSRRRVLDLLLRSHGVGVLEQIIVLDAARSEAAARGLSVTAEDVDAEYQRSLRRLLSPLPAREAAPVDRETGERVLNRILSLRNISRAEYLLGLRRNAYLREIVEHEMQFTDAQLEAERRRSRGERVKVRHIQLSSFVEAERIMNRLARGEDFVGLARNCSANPNTAPSGGLLRVFSREDEDVPELMRKEAFNLQPGHWSDPLRIGEWYQIIKLDERYPAESASLASSREELAASLRRRLTGPAMQQLHQTLLRQADVKIMDPVLAEEFDRKREPARD